MTMYAEQPVGQSSPGRITAIAGNSGVEDSGVEAGEHNRALGMDFT